MNSYNQSVKDALIEQVAEKTSLPEDVCDTIVMWAYKQAKDATSSHASVELSGFGTLQVSQTKIKREMDDLCSKIENAPKRYVSSLANEYIARMEAKHAYLKTKIRT